MKTPTRPVLRWYGGKWRLAPWIISYFPKHRVYVEPFGGAGSVLLRKPHSYAEVWNDLDDWAVNLFRVLRDDLASARLVELLRVTPFARSEFELARQIDKASGDPVEMARLLVVLSGYPSTLYDDALGDWQRVEVEALADGARPRTEVLWINPAAVAALAGEQMPLFSNGCV